MNKHPTILILDSGVGGLSIYITVKKILPNVSYIYFFDNQAFPYGKHSETFIINRVLSIINIIRNQCKFDLVIIACNTASVVGLQVLRTHFTFPIIGTIPAIKSASQCTKNGIVGILATHRTIQNNYTKNLIKRFISKKHTVMLLETSELVHLAESKIYGKKVSKLELHRILIPWLKQHEIPDTIVLGCTHFSLLKPELLSVLPKNSCLIDSRKSVAYHTMSIVYKLFDLSINNQTIIAQNKAYCSMNTPNLQKVKTTLLLKYNFTSLEILPI